MGLLRTFGILLLVLAVALIVYDAALYFRGGAAWALTTLEKVWQMAGLEGHFGLRGNLASVIGSAGDIIADIPAAILSGVLGVVLMWAGRK